MVNVARNREHQDFDMAEDANAFVLLSVQTEAGFVEVFDWNGTHWEQRGERLTAVGGSSHRWGSHWGSAQPVTISANGKKVVVGDPNSANNIGSVTVYDWDGMRWQDRTIRVGNTMNSFLGSSVALSAEGDTLVVGGTDPCGRLWRLPWNGTKWETEGYVQRDDDAVCGNGIINRFGWSSAISADGLTVASGGPQHNVIPSLPFAAVYTWNGTNLEQVGVDIQGPRGSVFGNLVSLSSDATVLAVGEYGTYRNTDFAPLPLRTWVYEFK